MTLVAGGVVVVGLKTLLAGRFVLKQADFVVVGFHHDPDSLRRVDVSQEMRGLGTRRTRIQLMSFLQNEALRGDLRDALDMCQDTASLGSRVRQVPMCFLDVEYTVRSLWRKRSPVYRCLYPIYSFTDYVHYPPTWSWALAGWGKGLDSAILTLRVTEGHGAARQLSLSCHVTSGVRQLEGPSGDFHGDSAVGYQLRKHILRVVLMPEISELMNAVPNLAGESEESTDADTSTSSLKSLSQKPSMSLRLQVRLAAAQRTEVMVL